MQTDRGNDSGKRVIVIGGGVAGIAASIVLADSGFCVELIEKRPLLGGRASSHIDANTGEQIDECQHGTMRCCTALAGLLDRLGIGDQIRYHDTLNFMDGEGRKSVISGCGLPAPFHTSLSFISFRSLGIKDKIGIALAMLAMLHHSSCDKLEHTTILNWFANQKQTERAIRRFWAPILVSATNETIDRISCTHAFKIFRDGFLLNNRAFHFGVPRVPLGTLYTGPSVAYIERRGGRVRMRTTVERLQFERDATASLHLTGLTLQGGEELTAEYFVLALQQDLLLKLLPEDITHGVPYWQQLKNIEVSPIIGVHMWFDGQIDCPEALALLDRDTEWLFNKRLNFDTSNGSGAYISAVISASRRYSSATKEAILDLVLADVHACLPQSRDVPLIRWQVIKWPKATFSPLPGLESLRPDQRSPIKNLFVAGEWTKTGWPSTMESAARSGYRAAQYLLHREGIEKQVMPPDLQPGKLARWLSRF